MAAAKRVLRYLCSTSGMGLVLGGRSPVVLTGHADASWVDDLATQRSSQGYTFSLGVRWLTYLLTDLGEPPRSPPVLYVDNKAMLALCREHRLEHRTKHFALRYFLACELQQRGQLRLAYVSSQANTADIFTKALQPCDHQRYCTMLGPACRFLRATAATAATAITAAATAATTAAPLSCSWALYDAVVARYSSPATAALGRMLLPYLFPELSAFATVEDLNSHLRTSDARYRATVPAEFLDKHQPPMFITLYFIVTRLPNSLRSLRDHFLSLDPTSPTIDLLEQHFLAAETSAIAVDVPVAEDVKAASASAKRHSGKGRGGRGGEGGSGGGGGGSRSGGGGSSGGGGGSGGGGSGGTGGGSGGSGGGGRGTGGSDDSGGAGTGGGRTGARRGGSGGGQRLQQQRRSKTQSPQQLREWLF
ncbi:unnamed protein product [Closterium sp. NIES-54]